MANTKSAKKRALTNELRRQRNVARQSDVKTACKKIEDALASNQLDHAAELLRVAESKITRAAGKKVVKKRTASRTVSRLAHKVSVALKLQGEK